MKKTILILVLALLVGTIAVLPLSAQKTDYQIGESEGGLLNDEKVKQAIQKAVDKFEEWMYEGEPSGYLTKQGDYYLQRFSDKDKQNAAVYVGADYGAFVLRGPIYEQLDTLGGFDKLGRPVSDAFQVNGTWYQNFEKGYATAPERDGKAVFTQGVHVDSKGGTVPLDVTDNATGTDSWSGSSGSDGTTDTTDTESDVLSSPSQLLSDVVDDVEEAAPKWGVWVFVLFLVSAIVILLVYWFLKRK